MDEFPAPQMKTLHRSAYAPMAPYSNFVNLDPNRLWLKKFWTSLQTGDSEPFATVIKSDEFTGPANTDNKSPPRVIVHFVRHAQSAADNPYNPTLDKACREHMLDPEVSPIGHLEAANLCRTFPRQHLITNILTSPNRRAISTASLGFRPAILNKIEVVLVPQLREFAEFPLKSVHVCRDKAVITKMYPELSINWKFVNEVAKCPTVKNKRFGWTTANTCWPSGEVERCVEQLKEMIFDEAMTTIEKGKLNKEGNVEIVVVSHGEKLSALIGLMKAEERSRQPWKYTQYRTFEFIDVDGKQAYETLKEIPVEGNGMAHIYPLYPMNKREYRFLGWDWMEICKAEWGDDHMARAQKADKEAARKLASNPLLDYNNPHNMLVALYKETEFYEKYEPKDGDPLFRIVRKDKKRSRTKAVHVAEQPPRNVNGGISIGISFEAAPPRLGAEIAGRGDEIEESDNWDAKSMMSVVSNASERPLLPRHLDFD